MILVAKTKALISFAVTAKLICTFVFRLCRLLVFPFHFARYQSLESRGFDFWP